MSTPTFYRPCALLAKAALVGDAGRRFDNVVVENDHGTVVLSGIVASEQSVSEAEDLAANASGTLVLNRVIVGF
jgi:osmotically-inducible protein OsmY